MKAEDFNRLVEARVETSKSVLCRKAEEYASSLDRLANFKKCAVLMNSTPEKALLGQVSKHIVAISDFIEALESGGKPIPWDWWDEKIGDTINFMMLLEGLLRERWEYSLDPAD